MERVRSWSKVALGVPALLGCLQPGCASQQATGEALQTAGTIAVVAATGIDPGHEGSCKQVGGSLPGDTETVCYRGHQNKEARAAIAGAGLGLSVLGAELQRTALDDVTSPAPTTASGNPQPKQEPPHQAPPAPNCRPQSVVFVASETPGEAEPSCE